MGERIPNFFSFFFLISVPRFSFFSAALSNYIHKDMELVDVRDNKRNEEEDQQRSFGSFMKGEENKRGH